MYASIVKSIYSLDKKPTQGEVVDRLFPIDDFVYIPKSMVTYTSSKKYLIRVIDSMGFQISLTNSSYDILPEEGDLVEAVCFVKKNDNPKYPRSIVMLPSLSRICEGDSDTFFQMEPPDEEEKKEPTLLEGLLHCPNNELIQKLVKKYSSAATFLINHFCNKPEAEFRSFIDMSTVTDPEIFYLFSQWKKITDTQGLFIDTAKRLNLDVEDKSVQLFQDVILINNASASSICAATLQDPFCLYDMLPRKFDLNKCLEIAEPLGFDDTHPFYIARLIRKKLIGSESSGNSFLDKWSVVSFADKVKRKVAENVLDGKLPEHLPPIECDIPVHAAEVKEDDNVVRKTVKRTVGDVTERFYVDDTGAVERVYLKETWTRQERWIEMIKKAISNSMHPFPVAPEWWQEEFMSNIEMELTKDQKEAVLRAYRHPLSIITGEAGSGKTTVTKILIDMIIASNQFLKVDTGDNLVCMAPTGKATRVFFSKTGRPCMTIDRFLCANFPREKLPDGGFKYLEFHPIVIIDEMSMVTLRHMKCIEKLEQDSQGIQKIVFIGDRSQLPAIGAGDVLHDTIQILKHSKVKSVTNLKGSKRVSEGSYPIYYNGSLLKSDRIKCGVDDEEDDPFVDIDFSQFRQEENIFQIKECPDIHDQVMDVVEQEIKDTPKPSVEMDWEERMKLMPLARLQIVTDVNRIRQNLNLDIQERVHEKDGKGKKRVEVKYDGATPFYLHVGDKVIVCVNSYETGVFNGDIGWVVDIVNIYCVHVLLEFTSNIVKVNPQDVKLTLAYVVTTHKSQGSDFDKTICVLEKKHRHTNRSLLYTMMTRGRERVDIICKPGVFGKVMNNPPPDRDSDMFRISGTKKKRKRQVKT